MLKLRLLSAQRALRSSWPDALITTSVRLSGPPESPREIESGNLTLSKPMLHIPLRARQSTAYQRSNLILTLAKALHIRRLNVDGNVGTATAAFHTQRAIGPARQGHHRFGSGFAHQAQATVHAKQRG